MANSMATRWKLDGCGVHRRRDIAQVLGTAAEYKVSEAADRNAGMVLKINKERLQALTPAK
jgi:hypothetical protein